VKKALIGLKKECSKYRKREGQHLVPRRVDTLSVSWGEKRKGIPKKRRARKGWNVKDGGLVFQKEVTERGKAVDFPRKEYCGTSKKRGRKNITGSSKQEGRKRESGRLEGGLTDDNRGV